MFTIDLLKGQNIPSRHGPKVIAFLLSAFILPFVLIIILLCSYFSGHAEMQINRNALANCEKKIAEFSDIQKQLESIASQSQYMNACLSEVSVGVVDHMQWSQTLAAIAQNLPNGVTINKLQVNREKVKDQTSKKDFYKYILQIGVNGSPNQSVNDSIQLFINQLGSCPLLKSKVENIQLASQQLQSVKGKDLVFYEINCFLREKL
jgi:hypothetical protein